MAVSLPYRPSAFRFLNFMTTLDAVISQFVVSLR